MPTSRKVRAKCPARRTRTDLTGLMVFTGVNTLLASILDVKPYLHLQLAPHITKYHQASHIHRRYARELKFVPVLAASHPPSRLSEFDRASSRHHAAHAAQRGY